MLFPIAPKHSTGKDTIAYWENFLSDEDINYILTNNSWDDVSPGSIGGSAQEQNVINKTYRTTDVAWMHPNQDNAHIWSKISETISAVNAQFFRYNLTGLYEPIQLGVYKAEDKGHYNWHIDGSHSDTNTPRKLSMCLMLSDPSEFEGGELQVKIYSDEAKCLEQKKGRAWFFPSYVLHRVTPVTKGIRKSLVLWVGGPEFK